MSVPSASQYNSRGRNRKREFPKTGKFEIPHVLVEEWVVQASGSEKQPSDSSVPADGSGLSGENSDNLATNPERLVEAAVFGDHDQSLPPDPLIGKALSSEYQIIELIGTGGWSRVYKAKRNSQDDYVAIKVLHSHLLFDQESVSRFEREAKSQAGLSHPNICRVFDYNRLDTGQPYIVMEYLDGESLSAILRRKGKVEPSVAVPIFAECCRGLKAAHDQGIVHRDVKPANIFMIETQSGKQIKLLDFGMAKIIVGSHPDLTQTGTAFGTVQYMSPEQALGDRIDGRSDIYALGCVMYETLTGKRVFEGRTAFGIMDQHVRAEPKKFREVDPVSIVSPDLEAVIMKALAKNADDRFQSAGELVDVLEVQSLKAPASGLNSVSQPQHHIWWIAALSILFALALTFAAR